MGVTSLAILFRPVNEPTCQEGDVKFIKKQHNVTGAAAWKRKDVESLLETGMKILIGRVAPGQMRSLEYQEANHNFHIVVKPDGRAACCVADRNYPNQSGLYAALSLLSGDPNTKDLAQLIKSYQDPGEADKLIKVQREIDGVRRVMLENVDKVLARGQKIDDLVEQSAELNLSSKKFYNIQIIDCYGQQSKRRAIGVKQRLTRSGADCAVPNMWFMQQDIQRPMYNQGLSALMYATRILLLGDEQNFLVCKGCASTHFRTSQSCPSCGKFVSAQPMTQLVKDPTKKQLADAARLRLSQQAK
ncbi:MAG: putative Ykt6 protein [Streblomastix strix]|uniref:Putative Ykt6 protein n=1 Tax=Streblomastix strix TaxID=222440 RepID=A0A5J4WNU5_9EUKA|nr:MAG: putative Ykt6 protein [Streblomastix strix]